MKSILVTGGLGFIGSHLVDALVLKGNCSIVVIDNLVSSTVDEYHWPKETNVVVVIASIQDFPIEKYQFEEVYHLASIVGPKGVLNHGGNIGNCILNDTLKIKEYCIERDVHMIDISTSEIYGHTGELHEDSPKMFRGDYKIRTEYAAAKMLAEMALVNEKRQLKFTIIRPFNVTGERQKPDGGFVLPRFVLSCLLGQPITVFGSGKQVRAFTYVKDIVDCILNIVYSDKLKGSIWNIGNKHNNMSILEMAERVKLEHVYRLGILYSLGVPIISIDPILVHGKDFVEPVDKLPSMSKYVKIFGDPFEENFQFIMDKVFDYYQEEVKRGYTFQLLPEGLREDQYTTLG